MPNSDVFREADRLLERGPHFEYLDELHFTTQLLHLLGGSRWDQWNGKLREPLIEMQERNGPQQGSWPPRYSKFLGATGRFPSTVWALLALEIRYRFPTIYRRSMVPKPFPLD